LSYFHNPLKTNLQLLGYGPVGDLCAIIKHRQSITRPERRNVTSRQVLHFETYARILATKYAYHGSGADEKDVEQEALVAAWKAIEEYRPGKLRLAGFVASRMRWRVLDFVRIRNEGQEALERRTTELIEEVMQND
jgi:DNA-directed RNA polymerase specialized sigma24 family protein